MARVVHFDLPADNVERAIKFYTDVFGWKFEKWQGPMDYWLVMTGADGEPGIDGGLSKRSRPDERVVNTVDVRSVDEAVKKVEAAGGRVTRPKQAVPGVGWLAYCVDTEGNPFGMMQEDRNAR